jgi:ATP-dependent exoDNAse (exonuclease V) alpha subunit
MSKRKLFKVAKINNVKELSLVVYNVSALVVPSVSVRASSDLLHLETAYCCTVHSK